MPLSWNEIRQNAIQFSREWVGEKSESAEKQTFWNAFFEVFGILRRTVAAFERAVKSLGAETRHIALFWPATLIVEQIRSCIDFDFADSQSIICIYKLADSGRQDEIPRYDLATDYQGFCLIDLEPEDPAKKPALGGYRIEFSVAEFHRHINDFSFIPGFREQA